MRDNGHDDNCVGCDHQLATGDPLEHLCITADHNHAHPTAAGDAVAIVRALALAVPPLDNESGICAQCVSTGDAFRPAQHESVLPVAARAGMGSEVPVMSAPQDIITCGRCDKPVVVVDETGGDVCGWNGGNEPHEIADRRELPDPQVIYDQLQAFARKGVLSYVLPTEPLGERWVLGLGDKPRQMLSQLGGELPDIMNLSPAEAVAWLNAATIVLAWRAAS